MHTADKYSKKHLKVCEADALKQVDANRLELEAQLKKASKEEEIRDSLSARNKRIIKLLAHAYILYFKELLSNNSRIFASVIGITKTQVIVLLAIIRYVYFKN
ncbi:hypothetical protein HBI11_232510 [Parastagonospora nodorum]|nr:hypothetical protein HBI11_232510 [Parastagonospora nodorum]